MRKPKAKGLSAVRFAKLAGVGRATVSRWLKAGRLELDEHGLLPASSVALVRAWRREEAVAGAALEKVKGELLAARRDKERALAELRQLEAKVESGRFVELDVVQRDAQDTCERVVGVLRAVPQRISLSLDAALSAPPARRAAVIEVIVAEEIERAIGALAESQYVQPAPAAGARNGVTK